MSRKRKQNPFGSNDYLCFYSEHGYFAELSNFARTTRPIVYNGLNFQTSEHLYQYLKYDYPNAPAANKAHAEAIRTARTPAIAKVLAAPPNATAPRYEWHKKYIKQAQSYGSVLRPNWDNGEKEECMKLALLHKFTQDPHSRFILTQRTFDRKLVEASPFDNYWGSGKSHDGQNRLGVLLMELRELLRKEERNEAIYV